MLEEKNKIAKQILNTFLYRIIAFVSLILKVLIIGKNFPKEITGTYDLIMGVVTFGIPLFGFNLFMFMIRTVPGKDKERQLVIFKTILFLEVATATIIISLIMLTRLDSYLCNILKIYRDLPVFRLGLLIVLIQIIAIGFMRFFTALKRIEFSNFLLFIHSNSWVFVLSFLWIIGVKITLTLFFLVWVGGTIISIFIAIQRTGIRVLKNTDFDFSMTAESFKFAVPLIAVQLGIQIVDISSKYILSGYYTAAAVGIYFFAYRPLRMIYDFITAIGISVINPYVIEAHNLNKIRCY